MSQVNTQVGRDGGGEWPDDGTDPAQRALADALRVCFWVLKAAMVCLVVLYVFSGVFSVAENEMAVRLRLGRIVGERGAQILEPGGPYFSLPYPIEQVVRIPVAPQQLEVNRAFWYEVGEARDGRLPAGRTGPLHPERDGSLITGDANIVHARWSVTYAVSDPVRYLTHVKDSDEAERLVSAAVEQGAVHGAATVPAESLIKAQWTPAAKRRAQAALDRMDSGIEITGLTLKQAVFPLSVRRAVEDVLNAESVRTKAIEEAQAYWTRTLVEAAGEAYEPLLALIEEHEVAAQSADRATIEQTERHLDEALDALRVTWGDRPVSIGGQVAELVHGARTYRTQVQAQVRSEAEYFTSLLAQYRKNPQIVLNRLWQDTKEAILTGDIETIYLPKGQAYLELNRDPKVRQDRERRKLIEEEQGSP